VKKTSLYLDPAVDRALARRAAAAGITKAELIRAVLAEAAAGTGRPAPSVGVFDGPPDLAGAADEHLAASRFGER
jgi:hypothetical protein